MINLKFTGFYVIVGCILMMIVGSCTTNPASGAGNGDREEIIMQEEYTDVSNGHILITGRSIEGYKEARTDAIDQLLLYLGALEIRSKNVIESIIVSSDFENSRKNRTVNTKEEASMITVTEGLAILPPIGKIEFGHDKSLFYAYVYISKNDMDRIITMIDITKAFPIEAKNGESMGALYFRNVIALKTMLTSGQAVALANHLESNFFVSTVIRDNVVYVYPRDRYENRIIRFLEQYFGNVKKNGNVIAINEPHFEAQEQKDAFDLRSVRISSNVSVPELNNILRQNGLVAANKATQERFLCEITFTEIEKAYGISINVEITIIDKKEELLLLSHALISPNYPKYNTVQLVSLMKNETVEYMRDALPDLLINY